MRQIKVLNPPIPVKRTDIVEAVNPEVIFRPQTFAADIFVPLLQNLIGGGAAAGLGVIVTTAINRWQGSSIDPNALATWCALAGGFVTCTATIVRFFGDDIGLLRTAYRAGKDSMRLRVNALELELQAARTQIAKLIGKTNALPPTKKMQELQRVYKAAQHLIHWHFEQLPIDRRSCEQRHMPQSDWRRARHLLIAAGVMNDTGITIQTLPETLAKVHAHYQKAVTLGGNAENFVSPH